MHCSHTVHSVLDYLIPGCLTINNQTMAFCRSLNLQRKKMTSQKSSLLICVCLAPCAVGHFESHNLEHTSFPGSSSTSSAYEPLTELTIKTPDLRHSDRLFHPPSLCLAASSPGSETIVMVQRTAVPVKPITRASGIRTDFSKQTWIRSSF